MRRWPIAIPAGISPADAQEYCVQHAEWQRLRLWLKTQNTEGKLAALWEWYTDGVVFIYERRQKVVVCETQGWIRKLQVTNYLGALRRGGQLDMHNAIKRER
jgi:hypothetical protein